MITCCRSELSIHKDKDLNQKPGFVESKVGQKEK